MTLQMLERAERDDDGRLIWDKPVDVVEGVTQTHEVDVTALLQETPRVSGDVSLLVIEAEQADDDDRHGPENPARPATAEVAEDVVARLDEGVRPAWEVVG